MSVDRRTTIKWMFAAAATVPSLQTLAHASEPHARDVAAGQVGYGTDLLGTTTERQCQCSPTNLRMRGKSSRCMP